jgi:hypothetical protein
MRQSIVDLLAPKDNSVTGDDPEYEERYVAFVDILGWKAATLNCDPVTLHRVLTLIAARARIYNDNFRRETKQRRDVIIPSLYWKVQYSFFSDCFVMSTPIDFGPRILEAVGQISLMLLQAGFLSRGAVVQANIFHKENFVYGAALVTAVELEKKAHYPRILFDQDSITEMPMWNKHFIIEDNQGAQIINLFNVPVTGGDPTSLLADTFGFSEIVNSLRVGLESSRKNINHHEKWCYMRDNVVRVLETFGQAGRPYIVQLS